MEGRHGADLATLPLLVVLAFFGLFDFSFICIVSFLLVAIQRLALLGRLGILIKQVVEADLIAPNLLAVSGHHQIQRVVAEAALRMPATVSSSWLSQARLHQTFLRKAYLFELFSLLNDAVGRAKLAADNFSDYGYRVRPPLYLLGRVHFSLILSNRRRFHILLRLVLFARVLRLAEHSVRFATLLALDSFSRV